MINKIQLIILALFAGVLFSCSNSEKPVVQEPQDSVPAKPDSVAPVNCDTVYFVKDEIYDDFFGFPPALQSFRTHLKGQFKHGKKPSRNPYTEGQIDTIDNIYSGADSVLIYRMPDKDIFYAAYLQSNVLLEKSPFRIGMSKADFARNAGIQHMPCDSVRIGEEEGLVVFSFIFRDSTLHHIRFDGYLD